MSFRIKRIYEPVEHSDGVRILVDRVWPQGISRFDAEIALWLKDIAPTTELRRWFGHKPERWSEFRRRYRAELAHNEKVDDLRKVAKRKRATLLYAARDPRRNNAAILAAWLRAPRKYAEPASLSPGPHGDAIIKAIHADKIGGGGEFL